jgi:cytochrome c553
MNYMVEHLPDDYLREIAAYFAAQHPAPPPAQPSGAGTAALARGRQLVLQGDPGKKIPACIACHGQQLAGAAPAIPGLLGLPRDYINAQLGAWKNGIRRARRRTAWRRWRSACRTRTWAPCRPGWARRWPAPRRAPPAASPCRCPCTAAASPVPRRRWRHEKALIATACVAIAAAGALFLLYPGDDPGRRRPPAPCPRNN